MAYNKTTWSENTQITANAMNNIEGGIKDIETTVTNLTNGTTRIPNATNSDLIDGKHVWIGSQAQYNALSKDANTIYFIY